MRMGAWRSNRPHPQTASRFPWEIYQMTIFDYCYFRTQLWILKMAFKLRSL